MSINYGIPAKIFQAVKAILNKNLTSMVYIDGKNNNQFV